MIEIIDETHVWTDTGRISTTTFRQSPIDPVVLKLFKGEFPVNVGDTIKYSDFDDLPTGAVVLFPSGDAHVRSRDGIFLFRSGVLDEFGDMDLSTQEFKLIHLPEVEKPKAVSAEVQSLAETLWGIRNNAVVAADRGYLAHSFYDDGYDGDVKRRVYLDMAAHVLGNYRAKEKPGVLIDSDGDRWIPNGDGTYDMYWHDTGRVSNHYVGYTRERIERELNSLTLRDA